MPGSQIIIFTNKDDSHADAVVATLTRWGHPPIRLNTDDLPAQTVFDLAFDGRAWLGGITLTSNGRGVRVDDVRSVWVRRPLRYPLAPDLTAPARRYVAAETDHTLGGLWASLDCYWMSRPAAILAASWKSEQLQRAASMGFAVPRTILTTDPGVVRAFHARCAGRVVFKSMVGAAALSGLDDQAGVAQRTYGFPTTLVGDAELAAADSVRLAPSLFQEYVDKDVELRVTVIGDEVFAAAIDSQADPRTAVDYRRFDVPVPYRRATLPPDVAERCVAFVHSYGLTFGAIDLIRTPDGSHVFVENNPVGQFRFVERFVPELPLTDALASCLLRGANSP